MASIIVRVHITNETESDLFQDIAFKLGFGWTAKLEKKKMNTSGCSYLSMWSDHTLGRGSDPDLHFFIEFDEFLDYVEQNYLNR